MTPGRMTFQQNDTHKNYRALFTSFVCIILLNATLHNIILAVVILPSVLLVVVILQNGILHNVVVSKVWAPRGGTKKNS
jgi:hypothetical protein